MSGGQTRAGRANQLTDRPAGGGRRLAFVAREQTDALGERCDDETHGGRALEHGPDRVLGDPVCERVLRRPGDESEGLLLEQRGEPEHLALAEQVQKAPAAEQLYAAAPDDVGELGRGPGAVQDRRPGRVLSTSAVDATVASSPSSSVSNGG